jgi:heterodisulfide reductase subunit A
MSDSVLVIGGGIAGIQASLDLAEAGSKVILVERSPAIGGKMAGLDKNFPTLDCSICIEAPKMSDVTHNPNITVLTLSEVEKVEGKEGNFTVTIYQKPRFVTSACTTCDLCTQACPQLRKNEFDYGVGVRKAIYTPYSQAEPGMYVIDIDSCLNEPPNYLPCNRCMNACGPNAIDFNMRPKQITEHVGAIIVATGFELFNASLLKEFGYGTDPDILTSMEFERLVNAAGPSDGEIIVPSTHKEPENVLFVLCAGSRDQRYVPYCSRFCCMYSVKESIQAKDHGIKNITILYMDIRAYGKGFDEFFNRSKESGVRYIRSRPSNIRRDGEHIKVRYESFENEKVVEENYDMVILATAAIPGKGTKELAAVLGIELDKDGFFKTAPSSPVKSTREGIFIAGCASGPKDIPDSVTEASAAAAESLQYIDEKIWIKMPVAEPLELTPEPRVGVFLCDCGSNIAGVVDVKSVKERVKGIKDVVYVEENKYTCAGSTQDSMVSKIREHNLNRVVVGACSPKTHGITFQRVCARAGLNPYLFEMANVRNMDSWVHKNEKEAATEKAFDMVDMAVAKARYLEPLEEMEIPVTHTAVVVGGGIAGITAATALEKMGISTHLIEKEDKLGGLLNNLSDLAPIGQDAKELLSMKIEELEQSGAEIHLSTTVKTVTGFVGNFNIQLSDGKNISSGAIVMATGADPYEPKEFSQGNIMTSLELEKRINDIKEDKVTIVSCIGSRNKDRGCSRFCCSTMLNQAVQLREQGKKVRVLYKDIRAYARFAEELYKKASDEGVQFFHYDQEKVPEEVVKFENGIVSIPDELTGETLNIPTDLLVLNIGLVPKDNEIINQLKLSRDQEGFLLELHPKLGPVEAAVSGVFLAGTAQGPKDAKESMMQGLATAAKASKILFKDKITKEPLIAYIDQDKCIKCMKCTTVCPYGAIKGELKKHVEIVPAMCMGCGDCIAECPTNAISMPNFTDAEILTQVDAATEKNADEKLVVFACNWCSYAGADQAGISKIQYPPSARVIRTMCSSRVSQKLVMRAFERGAAAVLVTGCHINDCHYIDANLDTEKRVERWRKFLQNRNINPDRLQLWWVSAAEGNRFAYKIREMDKLIKGLSKDEIHETPAKLKGVKS